MAAGRLQKTVLATVALGLPAVGLALAQRGKVPPAQEDAVARLQRQIDSGTVKLTFDPRHGYLPAVLKTLGVPASSQTLVFSKTSFQFRHISQRTPRALYFNDDTVVGWVPDGDVMEVATADPKGGANFYLLRQEPGARPRFVRQGMDCLQCHQGSMTQGVPGFFMRSIYPQTGGQLEPRAPSYITTDKSPFEERWGGWYVTGTHGGMRHMGNVVATNPDVPDQIDRDAGANVTDLSRYLDTSPYLAKTSDIVALMVAEHQGNVLNLIAKVAEEAKQTPPSTNSIEPLVQALLFSGELKLKDTVSGSQAFVSAFEARGPRDKKGRSLRDFDLKTRLFRYPCSYLIYSRPFNALAKAAKKAVYQRLLEVLTGKDRTPPFAHLGDTDRKAILEILMATKQDFVGYRMQHAA